MKSGIILYYSTQVRSSSFRDLLLLAKHHSDGKSVPFSFVDHETSLHQQMTLWENIKIETGFESWSELKNHLSVEYPSLKDVQINLDKQTSDATCFEKFLTSFVKSQLANNEVTLIHICESQLSDFELKFISHVMLEASKLKRIYIKSFRPEFWEKIADVRARKDEFGFNLIKHIKVAA